MARSKLQLVTLAVLLACCVAQQSTQRRSFTDVLHGRTAGPISPAAASVASVQADNEKEVSESTAKPSQESEFYQGYHTEEREVCLQEVSRRACTGLKAGTCTTAGCQIVNELWTSDFACCDDVYKSADDYSYGRDGGSISYRLRNPAAHSSAGYCDWFISHVDSTAGGVEVSPGIKKYGKASAICYYGGKEGDCGTGPFCEGMTFELSGYWYQIDNAYSVLPGGTVTDEGTCRTYGGWINDNDSRRRHARRLTAEGETAAVTEADATAAAESVTASTQSFGLRGFMADDAAAIPVSSSVSEMAAESQYYEGQHDGYHYGHHDGNGYGRQDRYGSPEKTVYLGPATVISGIVSSTAGHRKEKWDSGVFEWVVDFKRIDGATGITTTPDPSLPWVRDKQFKFTFYTNKGYSAA